MSSDTVSVGTSICEKFLFFSQTDCGKIKREFHSKDKKGEKMCEIAYQNKDITSKLFAERFQGKSLKVYGLNLPPVRQALPTNIPQIMANELKIDNVFLLEDNTIAVIDYESDYKKRNKHKYVRYVNHVSEHYGRQWKKDVIVRMIVIYTADVERSETSDLLDAGCLKLETQSVFLSEMNSEEISRRLYQKVADRIPLSEEELMEFIILPLTYRGKDEKNKSIGQSVHMANQMEDEEQRVFVLSGIAVFADKVIEEENMDMIRRYLGMTKVGQLFEDEKIRAVKEATVKVTEKVTKEVTEKAAEKALKQGFSVESIAEILSMTEEEVLEIQEKLSMPV